MMELKIKSQIGSMNEEIMISEGWKRSSDRIQSEIPDRCTACY